MFKNLFIKWNSSNHTVDEDGKLYYALNLLSYEYEKDMLEEINCDEFLDMTIKALHYKYFFKTLYWWIRYGFKCNKMYWYKNSNKC